MLSTAFKKRIEQLGISRREFTRRSGLSRQTIHNIEVGGRVELAPSTFHALDEHLRWTPGTAWALAHNDDSLISNDPAIMEQRAQALRWIIVERIKSMPLEDLETLVYQWADNEMDGI